MEEVSRDPYQRSRPMACHGEGVRWTLGVIRHLKPSKTGNEVLEKSSETRLITSYTMHCGRIGHDSSRLMSHGIRVIDFSSPLSSDGTR